MNRLQLFDLGHRQIGQIKTRPLAFSRLKMALAVALARFGGFERRQHRRRVLIVRGARRLEAVDVETRSRRDCRSSGGGGNFARPKIGGNVCMRANDGHNRRCGHVWRWHVDGGGQISAARKALQKAAIL